MICAKTHVGAAYRLWLLVFIGIFHTVVAKTGVPKFLANRIYPASLIKKESL